MNLDIIDGGPIDPAKEKFAMTDYAPTQQVTAQRTLSDNHLSMKNWSN